MAKANHDKNYLIAANNAAGERVATRWFTEADLVDAFRAAGRCYSKLEGVTLVHVMTDARNVRLGD